MICPECQAKLDADAVVLHEIIHCPNCGTDFEVISINPIIIDYFHQEGEDWGE